MTAWRNRKKVKLITSSSTEQQKRSDYNVNAPLIPGGFILLSRKLIESEIWKKPPLYLKVWVYLLLRAQHAPYKKLHRGQLRTSIPEIQAACSWYIGFRKVTPTKAQIFQVLEWLRYPNGKTSRNSYVQNHERDATSTMIATLKGTHGLLVTIDKYDFYQDPKNYEGNTESINETGTEVIRRQRQPNNINKNLNNGNKNNIYTPEFEQWYSAYPRPQAKQDTFKNFEKVRKEKGLEIILQCTKNYMDYINSLPIEKREFCYSSNNFLGQKAYYLDFVETKKYAEPKKVTQTQLALDKMM